MAIRIVSDASAGLPRAFCQEEGILLAPLGIHLQDELLEETYLEDMIDPTRLAGAKTSQAQLRVFAAMFERIVLAGDEAVCFCLSSSLSGTFAAAKLAAEMVGGSAVRVVDTKTGVGGHRILVENAVRRRNAGASLEEILEAAAYEIAHCAALFTTGDLQALRRSGRLGGAQALLGGMMRVHPVLCLNEQGAIQVLDRVRGEQRALDALVERLPNAPGRVAVCYTKEEERAAALLEQLRLRRPACRPALMRAGAVIACHLGLSAFGLLHVQSPEDGT